MKETGGKYFADFVIFTPADMEKHIPAQKKLAADNFNLFWDLVDAELTGLRRRAFYKGLSEDVKNSLELYTAFNCLDYGVFGAFSKAIGARQAVPWLTKCKVLREENSKPAVNVPVLNRDAAAILWDACARAHRALEENLSGLLAEFIKGRSQRLPGLLTSVPPHKRYMYAYNALVFATVREARP